jgi:hypothetical protein
MVWYRLYGPVAMVPLVAEHIVVRAVCAQAHSMKELIKDNMEAMEYLVSEVEFFNKRLGNPEIEVLLALKDELRIPDDWWQPDRKATSTPQLCTACKPNSWALRI